MFAKNVSLQAAGGDLGTTFAKKKKKENIVETCSPTKGPMGARLNPLGLIKGACWTRFEPIIAPLPFACNSFGSFPTDPRIPGPIKGARWAIIVFARAKDHKKSKPLLVQTSKENGERRSHIVLFKHATRNAKIKSDWQAWMSPIQTENCHEPWCQCQPFFPRMSATHVPARILYFLKQVGWFTNPNLPKQGVTPRFCQGTFWFNYCHQHLFCAP